MDFSFPTQPLAKCAKFLSGGTPSKSNPRFWGGNIPWITPKDMSDWNGTTADCVTNEAIGNGTRLTPAWTSYVAVRGMSLHNEIRVIRPSFAAAFNQDIKAIQALDGVEGRFLYYCLVAHKRTLLERVESAGHGTGRLPTDQLENLPIPVVDRDVAVSIAKILGDLDDKIDLLRAMNGTLEETARTLFRAWFVDFAPIRAKIAGAPSFQGMPEALFETLPDSFEPSKVGEVPKGWQVKPIGEMADCVGGSTPSTANPEFWDSGENPFCTPKDMSSLNSAVLLDTERHITLAGVQRISSGVLPIGTVLLSSRAPIGYIAINHAPVSVNQGIIAMKPTVLPTEYLRFWLEFNMNTIKSNAGGTTFAEISKSKFRPICAVRPPENLLAAFSDFSTPIFGRIASNEMERAKLTALRDTLLPKLISGELQAPSLAALDMEEMRDGG
ncbi:restriction endonuclease subunit S [Rhizobium leguminosarum]|uniref:restriction endonuclease subunit S n=1 Tax=Rhizobium leguminosarum TaxID=384 RepID=UPI001C94649B|nr:restriction endonuclease subunit S [Rhizobium leguminosarum]MBY5775651.1 restriction endonuclease subunit S [Rhizobium leguminosarum]